MDDIKQINSLFESIKVSIKPALEDGSRQAYLIHNLDSHLARLIDSINELGFTKINIADCREKIEAYLKEYFEQEQNLQTQIFKLRFSYSIEAKYQIECKPYTRDLSKPFRLRVLDFDDFHIDSNNPINKHKYLPRKNINDFLKASQQNTDEVIWLNQKKEICEGSFTNIFFKKEVDGRCSWHTPALSCGILPGTMRKQLIRELDAVEGSYFVEDLKHASQIKLSNALIGSHDAYF